MAFFIELKMSYEDFKIDFSIFCFKKLEDVTLFGSYESFLIILY